MDQFGGKLSDELIEEYSKSPNWKDGKFVNIIETNTDMDFYALPKVLYEKFFEAKERIPTNKIIVQNFDKEAFLAPSDNVKIIWYGHSAILINMSGHIILIDPMLGPDASPIAPFRTERFSDDIISFIDEMPDVDLVLLSHDHYDHLDMDSIIKLSKKAKQFFVGLGIKRHLMAWGVDESCVTEFDWWHDNKFHDINVTYTPSRHFSGRGLTDKQTTLWGGWVLDNNIEKIYFTGDGGYGEHFKEIGKKLGPFDFGLIECGQYDELWKEVHMTPEESVQAAIDANVKKAMPVHWGAFSLSIHPWKDPIRRFVKNAADKSLTICHSEPGGTFCCADNEWPEWWEKFE